MAMDWVTWPIQFAQVLRIARMIEALQIFARDASNANHQRRLLVATNGFSTTSTQEAKILTALVAFMDGSEVPALQGIFTNWKSKLSNLQDGVFKLLAEDLGLSTDEVAFGSVTYQYDDALTDGTIAILKRRGVLGALYHQMLTDGRYVVGPAVGFGTFTAQNGNQGLLSVSSMTGRGHCLAGTLRFECDDQTVDAPKLKVTLTLDVPLPDGRTVLEADNRLTPDKSFEDGQIGLLTTIARSGLASPVESGDNGNIFSATSFSSPKAADSNLGIFYCKVTRQSQAPIWLIEFYSDSARTNKVGQATTDGTAGSVTFTGATAIQLNGGTSIVTTFDKAAAHALLPAAGNKDEDIQWDIDTPRIGDVWTRTVTNDDAGNYQAKTARLWRIDWPTTGSTLFTDADASSISMS